ncbi:MAG: hypothetical protein JXA49_05665 [Actinobacteria bacterium]|nr:hypothetical protein [Actinomycetota bacterium]
MFKATGFNRSGISRGSRLIKLADMLKGFSFAPAAAVGAFASGVLYGWFDYMAHPECFRAGRRPPVPDRFAPGSVTTAFSGVVAGSGYHQIAFRFKAGKGGVSEDGGLKLGFCRVNDKGDGPHVPEPVMFSGWGVVQNTRPRFPNFFSCSVESDSPVRIEVEKKSMLPIRFFFRCCARELMRYCGVTLEPMDYPFLYFEYSKVKVRIRECRLNEGDEVVITLGDMESGSPGWKVPAAPLDMDVYAEVDERALGIYRPIENVPTISMTPRAKRKQRKYH